MADPFWYKFFQISWYIVMMALWLLDVSSARSLLLNAPYSDPIMAQSAMSQWLFLFAGPIFAWAPVLISDELSQAEASDGDFTAPRGLTRYESSPFQETQSRRRVAKNRS